MIAGFDAASLSTLKGLVGSHKKIFITGEGSSRLFPAKNVITRSLVKPGRFEIRTEAALQAMEYDLSGYLVLGLSNSGRTKEVVKLFEKLGRDGHPAFYSITANADNPPLAAHSTGNHTLVCGKEQAVAATKSVMEQALVLDILLYDPEWEPMPSLETFSLQLRQVLEAPPDPAIVKVLAGASKIYLVARDDGVGDELALKTNEIIRKRSMFLPGSYALHGIEEVMDASEALLLIDPFKDEEEKIRQVFAENIGMKVVAIADRQTGFPTMVIPRSGYFKRYLELAAGWNLLVEAGIKNGIGLDKGLRARKIGNEI